MKENMLDVLMYLFEHYIDNETDNSPDQEILKSRLADAGFASQEIDKAFDWLEDLGLQREEKDIAITSAPGAMRIYTAFETKRLNVECRGFLLFMEQAGVLSPTLRELIIDRTLALETEEIDLDKLKWVALMVFFNQQGETSSYNWIEDIVLDELSGNIH